MGIDARISIAAIADAINLIMPASDISDKPSARRAAHATAVGIEESASASKAAQPKATAQIALSQARMPHL